MIYGEMLTTAETVAELDKQARQPLLFAVKYELNRAEIEARHKSSTLADRPYRLIDYLTMFRMELGDLNDRLTLNVDGSSFRPTIWEGHEKELSSFSLRWAATLRLSIRPEGEWQIAEKCFCKCFCEGLVVELPFWPDPDSSITPRSPRPCPQTVEEAKPEADEVTDKPTV